jgi:pyruvyl transferase EpsO
VTSATVPSRAPARRPPWTKPSLADRVRAILDPLLAGATECALLDFQNHGNVGDSAIWLGEVAYLEAIGCRIRHVCSELDYDARALRRVVGDGPILLSGGGNFGDVWPAHQHFRERVLSDFPGHRIVQLPQSIHFGRTENARRAQRALARHRDLHLLARDHRSHALASGWLGEAVRLCPDMVHLVDGVVPPREPDHRLLVLARDDHEKRDRSMAAFVRPRAGDRLVVDWIDQPGLPQERAYHRARALLNRRWLPAAPLEHRSLAAANVLARQRVDWGVALLARARAIVTDRLHACLLGRQIGRRVYFVDNSYAKLSSYVETWLADDPELIPCEDFDAALRRADADLPLAAARAAGADRRSDASSG